MKPEHMIIAHNKNGPRYRHESGPPKEVHEAFYACGLEIATVAYAAIQRAYPIEERRKNLKVKHAYEEANDTVKRIFTRYKTQVRDDVVPLAKIIKHGEPYDDAEDRPTREFRSIIINNCLTMLYRKLRDNAPAIVPEELLEGLEKSLSATFETESKVLADFLSYYEARPAWSAGQLVKDKTIQELALEEYRR